MKYVFKPIRDSIPKHSIIRNGTLPYILELHGLASKAETILSHLNWFNGQVPYTIVATNHLEMSLFISDLDVFLVKYNEMLNHIGEKCYIIGHSLGGLLALFLSKNKFVEKVFAVSTFNSFAFLEKATIMNFFRASALQGLFLTERIYNRFEISKQKATFTPEVRAKIYLAHGLKDRDIPHSEFLANIHDLNIPKSRYLSLADEDHQSAIKSRDLQKWILAKLKT